MGSCTSTPTAQNSTPRAQKKSPRYDNSKNTVVKVFQASPKMPPLSEVSETQITPNNVSASPNILKGPPKALEDVETASFIAEFCLSIRLQPSVQYATISEKVDKMPKPGSPEATFACSVRLKRLIELVQMDQLSKTDLVQNLQYTVLVLEAIFDDETKRLANEQEELPGVATATVPNEVRDWLTMTFTRRVSTTANTMGKPTFRTVATAIRAGIVVDKIFRRMSTPTIMEMPSNLQVMLKEEIDTWEFDVIELNKLSENHSLKIIGFEILNRYDIIHKFKISTKTLDNLLITLEEGYSKHRNPYHNLTHAADVTQSCHYILSMTKLASVLNELEIFAIIFSALIHDFEHTGTTNNFHVKAGSELALVYNDKGVLENFHVSSVYQLMKDENLNILNNLSKEEYCDFRRLVVDMVLNTDMSLHFQQLNSVKSLLTVPENVDKSQALSLILHCADIAHPTKPWVMHERWTERLVHEFFRQGDMERKKGLSYSPLCDPNNTMVAQSQLGFINFIVAPSFEVMTDLLQKIMGPLFKSDALPEEVDTKSSPSQIPLKASSSNRSFPAPWFQYLKTNIEEWEKRKQIELKEKSGAST